MAPLELMEDAITEVLTRLPPGDPACLQRAALVCKSWRRILSDPAFHRRYRAYHRTPPLLGFFRNFHGDAVGPAHEFLPSTSFRPRGHGFGTRGTVVDFRHGRALFLEYTYPVRAIQRVDIVVWDPLTGVERRLRDPGLPFGFGHFTAVVLCAAAGCNHLGCHGGPFLVVFVASDTTDWVTRASVYSSQTGAWSARPPASVYLGICNYVVTERQKLVVAGGVIYFRPMKGILQYDLGRNHLSVIDPPRYIDMDRDSTLVQTAGGGLGVLDLRGTKLHLQCREASPDGIAKWTKPTAMDLDAFGTVKPILSSWCEPMLMGYAKGIVFISTGAGQYMIHLKSLRVKKIGEDNSNIYLYPYISFYLVSSRLC